MYEDFSKFSKVPRPQPPEYTPPLVPEHKINPKSDVTLRHPLDALARESGTTEYDPQTIAALMDTGPKPGESEADYRERMRVYRQGLEGDDHMDALYPPSSITKEH